MAVVEAERAAHAVSKVKAMYCQAVLRMNTLELLDAGSMIFLLGIKQINQ